MPGERRAGGRLRGASRALVGALLGTLAAGCDAPTMPGEAPAYDPTALSAGVLFGWPLGHTIDVFVHGGDGETSTPDPALATAVERALAAWEGATRYGELRLRRVADAAGADIVVRRAGTAPLVDEGVCGGGIGDGAGFALLCFCFSGDSARTLPLLSGAAGRVKVSVVIDPEATSPTAPLALDALVAHELGHALGIAGHSADGGDVMHAAPVVARPSERDGRTLRYVLHQPRDVRL